MQVERRSRRETSTPISRRPAVGRPADRRRILATARQDGAHRTADPTSCPMPKVMAMASAPPVTSLATARPILAVPSFALIRPVTASAISTTAKVTGTRAPGGGSRMANNGSSDPAVKARADARDGVTTLDRHVTERLRRATDR